MDFDASCMTLHTFSDASIKAYGAVVYLISQSQTAFVIAKSCIAPLKTQTLPWLELMAALVAARLTKFVMDSLKLTNTPVYVWVDSQIALHWIHTSTSEESLVVQEHTELMYKKEMFLLWGREVPDFFPINLLLTAVDPVHSCPGQLLGCNRASLWFCGIMQVVYKPVDITSGS